jgi:hypothetical protein
LGPELAREIYLILSLHAASKLGTRDDARRAQYILEFEHSGILPISVVFQHLKGLKDHGAQHTAQITQSAR